MKVKPGVAPSLSPHSETCRFYSRRTNKENCLSLFLLVSRCPSPLHFHFYSCFCFVCVQIFCFFYFIFCQWLPFPWCSCPRLHHAAPLFSPSSLLQRHGRNTKEEEKSRKPPPPPAKNVNNVRYLYLTHTLILSLYTVAQRCPACDKGGINYLKLSDLPLFLIPLSRSSDPSLSSFSLSLPSRQHTSLHLHLSNLFYFF